VAILEWEGAGRWGEGGGRCADAIVSGDADLIAMSPFREIEILGPGEYLERG